MYRTNLMRMLGGLLWVAIPVACLMLFLPHDVDITYELALFFLFCMLLMNFATILLPLRESLRQRYLAVLLALFCLAMLGLTCAAIRYTGGTHSPLFTLLILITAFTSSFFPSLSGAVLLSGFSATAYLFTILFFGGAVHEDAQLISTQVFLLLLTAFFINRLGVESREQALERSLAMEELQALSDMDRAASSFVSAVSFEMRTPLTSILGFSEMLASLELDPEKEQEYVNIISREADNLSRLVEDLLDISRLESGKLTPDREFTRLDQLLNLSLPLLDAIDGSAQVDLRIPSDLPGVMVDAQRMKRVFDAICAYIVRKSGRGSEVRASAKTEGREVVMTFNLRNRDAAIHHENGSRIFPLLMGQEEEDLDLAMAQRIVLAHKGSLKFIQASGGWSAIVLRLPEITARDFMSDPAPYGSFKETPA